MDIPLSTQKKLQNYYLNSDPFLWNTLKTKNKKQRVQELQALGYLQDYTEHGNPTYTKIKNDLLLELGITGIIGKIVIKRINELFTPEQLAYLRRSWEQGQTPPLDYFKKQGLYNYHSWDADAPREEPDKGPSFYKDPAYIFVQINAQMGFVERWTVFGGLWFEELEPLLVQ